MDMSTGDRIIALLCAPDTNINQVANASERLLRAFNLGYPIRNVGRLLNNDNDEVVKIGAWLVSKLGSQAREIPDDVNFMLDHRLREVGYHALDARQACPVFLELHRRPPRFLDPYCEPGLSPEEHFRLFTASGLRFFVCPEFADEFIEFATDRSLPGREFVVAALPKTKDSRVPQVLLGLLDDPAVCAFAIDALGKMRYEPARDMIAALLDDPDRTVRTYAKKALRRLDEARMKPSLKIAAPGKAGSGV